MSDFGDDISTFRADGTIDLDLSFTPIAGGRVVAEGVASLWIQKRGGILWDLARGQNILDLQNSDLDQVTLQRYKIALENEATHVDGVVSCAVTLSLLNTVLQIFGRVVTRAGTFLLNTTAGPAAKVLIQQAA